MTKLILRLYRCLDCGAYQHRTIPEDALVECYQCGSDALSMQVEG